MPMPSFLNIMCRVSLFILCVKKFIKDETSHYSTFDWEKKRNYYVNKLSTKHTQSQKIWDFYFRYMNFAPSKVPSNNWQLRGYLMHWRYSDDYWINYDTQLQNLHTYIKKRAKLVSYANMTYYVARNKRRTKMVKLMLEELILCAHVSFLAISGGKKKK